MKYPWQNIVRQAINSFETPLYIFTWDPVWAALQELSILNNRIPIRHWLSFKTQPVAPLIRKWRETGYGVEVVSEYEFLAAIHENYEPDRILVNGVAKHTWLSKYQINNIKVHFDSRNEIDSLIDNAIKYDWHVGIRCHVAEEYDPDEPSYSGQFGMLSNEAIQSIKVLKNSGTHLESIHFHLRSNVSSASCYQRSLDEIKRICDLSEFSPTYVDLGGGFPVEGEYLIDNPSHAKDFKLTEVQNILTNLHEPFPDIKEIWFENGRFITSRSGVLVVRILDIKERHDSRYIICDGGRTNNALISDWEYHDIFLYPHRHGPQILTTVCGPTCMAFDRLVRTNLPIDLQIGDYIIWMNAGAYHIPWETRFSNGLATVIWCDEHHHLSVVRHKEEFKEWWNHWL